MNYQKTQTMRSHTFSQLNFLTKSKVAQKLLPCSHLILEKQITVVVKAEGLTSAI